MNDKCEFVPSGASTVFECSTAPNAAHCTTPELSVHGTYMYMCIHCTHKLFKIFNTQIILNVNTHLNDQCKRGYISAKQCTSTSNFLRNSCRLGTIVINSCVS